MSKDSRIDYVELPAADLDVAQRFYEKVFHWQFTDFGPEYRAFYDGNMHGGFYKAGLNSSTDTGASLIVLYANQLEETMQRVVESGGSIVKEIFSFPGGRRFQFADPNGNELAVWSDK